MDRNDPRHWLLALCAIRGINWSLLAREAQRADGVDRLRSGHVAEDSNQAEAARELISEHADKIEPLMERVRRELEVAVRHGARLITVLDEDYPTNLRLIFNLPPFLFVRGELTQDDAYSVAVVGTREASEEGVAKARKMARALTADGVTVVSGMAAGVDTAAHEAALDAGGRTIAVLGTGVAHTYPKQNLGLAERIAAGGALVSQFWPSTPPSSYTFPRRNVVTSGISQGTVVIEATSTSGAKMQARLALEHGKRVFLIRSLVTDQPWAQKYVGRGAIVVSEVGDVIQHLRSPRAVSELVGDRQLALNLDG